MGLLSPAVSGHGMYALARLQCAPMENPLIAAKTISFPKSRRVDGRFAATFTLILLQLCLIGCSQPLTTDERAPATAERASPALVTALPPSELYGELFTAVQMNRVFEDSKQFA